MNLLTVVCLSLCLQYSCSKINLRKLYEQKMRRKSTSPKWRNSTKKLLAIGRLFGTKEVCYGQPFCDNPKEYPDKEIKQKVLEAIQRGIIGVDQFDNDHQGFKRKYSRLKRSATNVCDMVQTSHYSPRAADNIHGEQRWIVNHPEGDKRFLQLISIGECQSNVLNGSCAQGAFEFSSLDTFCQQEFTEHKLVAVTAVDGQVGEALVDVFRFPSCCTCQMRDNSRDYK